MNALTNKIKVLIADDHAILLAGLKVLIDSQADMEVVSEASDTEKAIQAALAFRPDVAVLDLSMPGGGGLKAIQEISKDCREIRLLVLTMHDDPTYLESAMAAGASGYLLKRAADTELITAIRTVHRGGSFVDPRLPQELS
jgi:two-component system response regulator NreC